MVKLMLWIATFALLAAIWASVSLAYLSGFAFLYHSNPGTAFPVVAETGVRWLWHPATHVVVVMALFCLCAVGYWREGRSWALSRTSAIAVFTALVIIGACFLMASALHALFPHMGLDCPQV